MKEKKSIKVSLGTFICIIIIILLVIALLCMWYYKNISDKNIINATNTNIFNTLISNELNKPDNSLSKSSNNISNKNEDNTGKQFSNEEIKTALQNYLNLLGAREGTPEGLLVKLGFNTYERDESSNNHYAKTSIKYSEFKSKILNYISDKWFDIKFAEYYKEIDGYLYFLDVGGSGRQFEVVDVILKGDYSEFSYIGNIYQIAFDDSKELLKLEFHIENYNGKCVISYCDEC